MSPAVGMVDRYRRRLDPSSRYEMPAHVTVLYPFVPPAAVDAGLLGELAGLFAGIDGFDFTLSEVRWFEKRVVYLAPSPEERFRAMTAAVSARFPDYPPYEGEFDDVVPHVTIGEDAPHRLMQLAGWLARRQLPITGRVSEVWLMTIGDGAPLYRLKQAFPLRRVEHER
jgi:2'-5' RNA ligase